jgi:uncharacterized protein
MKQPGVMMPSSIRTSAKPDRGFVVDVAALRRRPGSRREVHLEGEAKELFVTASRVEDGGLVSLDGVLDAVPGGVLVTASVTAPYVGECRRCLGVARGELAAEVVELITDEPDPDTGYVIDGDSIDLSTLAHDACILELPMAPLCDESCAGLCVTCGANMNTEPCSHTRRVDPRWSGLAGLGGGEVSEGADISGANRDASAGETTT